jgi:hypothetical protein
MTFLKVMLPKIYEIGSFLTVWFDDKVPYDEFDSVLRTYILLEPSMKITLTLNKN